MEITVGIDVSKARLDVHVHPAGESFVLDNDETGVDALAGRLGQLKGLMCIGIEASGRYERLAVAQLAGAGLPVVVLNPAQVRHYAQAIGLRAKSDPIDARLIALFVEAVRPEPRPLADAPTQELAALMARRRQLVMMLAAERMRRQPDLAGPHRSRARGQSGGPRPPYRHHRAWHTGVARQGEPARLGARHRQDHRPHAPGRAAGAGNAQS